MRRGRWRRDCGRSSFRRSGLRGRLLRRRFGLSIGTGLGRRCSLREDHRCRRILCMRDGCCELHDGERCRGQQREAKHCHDRQCVPGKNLTTDQEPVDRAIGAAINRQPLGRIVASDQLRRRFISVRRPSETQCSLAIQPPVGIAMPVSVAGDGVRGPVGPRTGSSSGVRPGNCCGSFGSPGSCTGGGISGRG